MELCRPLPWIADDKPRLGDFRRELDWAVERDPAEKQNPPGEVTSAQRHRRAAASPCPAFDVKFLARALGNIRLGAFRRQPPLKARKRAGTVLRRTNQVIAKGRGASFS